MKIIISFREGKYFFFMKIISASRCFSPWNSLYVCCFSRVLKAFKAL